MEQRTNKVGRREQEHIVLVRAIYLVPIKRDIRERVVLGWVYEVVVSNQLCDYHSQVQSSLNTNPIRKHTINCLHSHKQLLGGFTKQLLVISYQLCDLSPASHIQSSLNTNPISKHIINSLHSHQIVLLPVFRVVKMQKSQQYGGCL